MSKLYELNKFILVLCLVLGSASAKSFEAPIISLLTFEVGDQSHTVFGHTAIRVQDPIYKTDWVYNQGMFNFDTPFFLLKFAEGSLQYYLGIQEYENTIRAYFNRGRQVYEQKLNISEDQSRELLRLLQENYRPENRYYRYGFLKSNCSTKVRDLLFNSFEDTNYEKRPTNRTYRSYINEYMQPTPWYKFGANLLLGSKIDYNISTWELMFLPDFLSKESQKATLNDKPLAGKQQPIFEYLTPQTSSKWKLTPFILFSFLFVVMVLSKSRVISQTFIIVIGLVGLFALAVTLFSEHPEVQNNYNLLWCNPLYLLSFVLCFTQWKKLHRAVALTLIFCLAAFGAVIATKTQGFIAAFFPIIISLFWINIKHLSRK